MSHARGWDYPTIRPAIFQCQRYGVRRPSRRFCGSQQQQDITHKRQTQKICHPAASGPKSLNFNSYPDVDRPLTLPALLPVPL